MIHCSLDELCLTKYLPWKRTRLYQIAKKQPEILRHYGCTVTYLQKRIVIQVENKEIEERVLRIRELLKTNKKKTSRTNKTKKISVSLTPSRLILFENLKPAFNLFLDDITEDTPLPLKFQKKNIYLSEKNHNTIKRISQKLHIPKTKVLEGLIEIFLLNFSANINQQEVCHHGSNDSNKHA